MVVKELRSTELISDALEILKLNAFVLPRESCPTNVVRDGKLIVVRAAELIAMTGPVLPYPPKPVQFGKDSVVIGATMFMAGDPFDVGLNTELIDISVGIVTLPVPQVIDNPHC